MTQIYTIMHHSDFFGGNASEYILPKGNISITSHGLGSGIYGLSQEYVQKNVPDNGSNSYMFIIKNPYIISSVEEFDTYIESSMKIMCDIEIAIKNENILDIDDIAKNFVSKMTNFSIELVRCSLLEFYRDYYLRQDIVEMPINYILKKIGYDGVITPIQNWSKGNVKFIEYPNYKKGDNCDVAFLVSRSGISRQFINLKSKGYVLQDKKWTKMF